MPTNWSSKGNLQFLLGLSIGLAVSVVMTSYRELTSAQVRHLQGSSSRSHFTAFLHDDREHHHGHGHTGIEGNLKEGLGDRMAVNFEDTHSHDDDDLLAKDLANKHPVLCWIMTSPTSLDTKAIHVHNTWSKRCNKALFMSSVWNSTFPTVGLNVSEGREHLTAKTMQAFYYIYDHHFNDADWFMKADDDTYVIVENLRYFLSSYNCQEPIFFGHVFRMFVKPQGYTSGGAGYVLSKEALRRVATAGRNQSVCRQDGGPEDAEMGQCLQNLGVRLVPSVDKLGRSRFHCFGPEGHVHGSFPKWYYQYDANGARTGIENLSDYAISFHYMSAAKMYTMEYFVYHLRPYGIISRSQALNLDTGSQ